MLKNYLKVALRNILRHKGYSFINIFGLSIGMTACILILLYIQDEMSYDKYHENHENIYRVSRKWFDQDGSVSLHLGHVAPPFAPLLKNDFEGEVLHAVRFLSGGGPLIKYEDKAIIEDNFFFADEDAFQVFSWEFVKGNPATALAEPNALVLTESTAKRYFGDADPEGQSLVFNNYGIELPMKVTGVIQDLPRQSHFGVNMLCSFLTVENFFGRDNLMQNFGSNNYATYLLFPDGYDIARFDAQIPDFMDRHIPRDGDGDPNARPPHEGTMLETMALTDIHLNSHLDSEIEANGDIFYVRLYTVIAIFTLVIACINFMNLATARSARRAREVGVRKVMGAYRSGLIKQFISESVVFAVLALIVSVVLVLLILPSFNEFIQRELSLNIVQNAFSGLLMFGIVLFVGILAGSYPAFYLSNFKPVSILKGNTSSGKGNYLFRSGLVIFQFALSILLIIGVGVVQDQIDYMRTKEVGFNKSQLYVLPSNNEIYSKYESLRNQFLLQPGILDVSLSSRVPGGRLLDSQGTSAEVDGEFQPVNVRVADVHVDHGFLANFGVEFIAGRNFDPELASDSTESFILNEAAVNAIGWESPEEAIDKRFDYGGRTGGRVVGVVKDFHFESLHQSIAPIVFLVTNGRANNVVFRVAEGEEESTLAYLREQWSFLNPGFPFDYYTVEDRLSDQYANEDRLGLVIGYFSVLAIIIACLGLFGLSSFTAEQRIREIGIRKVLGASISSVMVLLTRNYTFLILIAMGFALIIGWYGGNLWLQEFAYSGGVSIGSLLFAGVVSLIIAWITIGYQTLRAAVSNPVDAIKHE